MSSVDRPVLSGVKALVVDDHHDSVQLLAAALEPYGVAVITAGSVAEARQILGAGEVDIIVSDLGLPGENGLELIRWVRSQPSGRDVPAIAVTFFSERFGVRKALDVNPSAALVFNWDAHERQARIEGPVTLAPDSDSDTYWSSRPRDARVAASASDQSQPIESRAAFLAKVELEAKRAGGDLPRPKRWGGYRVWAERVELWVGQPARAHDRALWTRALASTDAGFSGGSWRSTRLQP